MSNGRNRPPIGGNNFIDPNGTRRSRAGFLGALENEEVNLNNQPTAPDDDEDFDDAFAPPGAGSQTNRNRRGRGAGPPKQGGRGNAGRGVSVDGGGSGKPNVSNRKSSSLDGRPGRNQQLPLSAKTDGDEDEDDDGNENDMDPDEFKEQIKAIQKQASRVLPMCHKGEWPALEHVLKILERDALPSTPTDPYAPLKGIVDEVRKKHFLKCILNLINI